MTVKQPRRPPDGPVLAALAGGGRVWAVGAVHGECQRLRAVHRRIWEKFQPGDRVVYLGGMMGHGPDVAATIDEILLFRRAVIGEPGVELDHVVFLRGAQEEMWQKLLQLQFAQGPAGILTWMLDHGVGATIAAYGGDIAEGREAASQGVLALTRWTNALRQSIHARDGHTALMSSLNHAAYTDDGALLFVHAGVDPTRPLEAQLDHFWWGSSSLEAQQQPYQGFTRLIRGYAPQAPAIVSSGPLITLDGGAGRGGGIAAACLDGSGTVLDLIEA